MYSHLPIKYIEKLNPNVFVSYYSKLGHVFQVNLKIIIFSYLKINKIFLAKFSRTRSSHFIDYVIIYLI
jgi:hypothetical protein